MIRAVIKFQTQSSGTTFSTEQFEMCDNSEFWFLNTAGSTCFLNQGKYIIIHPNCYSGVINSSQERNHPEMEKHRSTITELS